jgi:creatinine amidohydrolase
MLWENLREEEFEKAVEKSNGVCILPVGCLEKHGQHLPVGTDTIIGTGVCNLAAEMEYAVVFPTMFFGEKGGAGEFAGTVMLSPELRFRILTEICDEIARNGFKKILIASSHGGNGCMIGNFTRSVLHEKKDYLVFSTSVCDSVWDFNKIVSHLDDAEFDFMTDEDKKVYRDFVEQNKFNGHACFMESALAYHFRPETVIIDKMNQESGLPVENHPFKEHMELGIGSDFAWMAKYPNSYAGSYHEGLNKNVAKALALFAAGSMAKKIKFLKDERKSDEYLKSWLAKQK